MNDEKLSNGANGASGDIDHYRLLVDNKRLSDGERLKLMSDLEQENDRDIYTAGLADGLSRQAELYETGRFARLTRLNPVVWKTLGPMDRMILHDYACLLMGEIESKLVWMSASLSAGIEVPQVYMLGDAK